MFKAITVYRVPIGLKAEKLAELLQRNVFVPCSDHQPTSCGFVPPHDQGIVHVVGRHWLICLKHEKRLLPAKVVDQVASDRAEEIEAQQGYKPGRKQMKEIKDAVLHELLPRAFRVHTQTLAWIDADNGLLIVGSTGAKADEMVRQINNGAGDYMPIKAYRLHGSAVDFMSNAVLHGEPPPGFTIDMDAVFESPVEGHAKVRYFRHYLDGEDVKQHLQEGKRVVQLALTHQSAISFVLCWNQDIKGIELLGVTDQQKGADQRDGFDGKFALLTGELQRLIAALAYQMGGVVQEEPSLT